MVERTFLAFDSESLIVDSSSNSGLVGNPIINNSDTPNGTVFTHSSGFGTTVTLDDTSRGGGRGRFNDDDRAAHTIVDGGGIVSDGANVESESRIDLRALDASGNPTGRTITIYVFSQGGDFNDIWGFAARSPLQDGVSYIKVSGSNDGTSVYRQYITCFADGTLIDTPHGSVPVDSLKVGDEVWTYSNGPLPLRWVASTTVNGVDRFAPVHLSAGALGNTSDLRVSQQHRILIADALAEFHFGAAEVLVAAKHLCGLPGIRLDPCEQITYTHVMFDSHQIVRSGGLLSESFFFADHSVQPLDQAARAELQALFPDGRAGYDRFGDTAAPTLNGREASLLRELIQ
ncbi:MAG: Hint domain-containing protein [Roseobacter sp.]